MLFYNLRISTNKNGINRGAREGASQLCIVDNCVALFEYQGRTKKK